MTTIVNTLGAGSGIDTDKLVSDLVAAQRLAADKALTARRDSATAKISAIGQVTSTLSAFSTALTSLATGGTLSAQASSSDTGAVAAAFTNGAAPLNSALEIRRLASSQTLSSTPIADATAAVGQGTLTFTFGAVTSAGGAATAFTANTPASSFTVTIGPGDDSLAGVASAINAAKGGVTATVVRDSGGSRLLLKGATGATQGFTVTADAPLSEFAFGVGQTGMSVAADALNAQLVLDGVPVESPSNTVTDLIPGVKLDLKKAQVGTTVALTSSRDTAALSDAVSAYVDAYNQVQSILTALTKAPSDADSTDGGALRAESSIRTLQGRLKALTSTRLLPTGNGPSSLAEIGVKTNRDGTLSIDSAALSKAVAADPDRIELLLTASQSSSSPLVAIGSASGAVKSGTYAITDIVAATAGTAAAGVAPAAFDTPVTIDATNQILRLTVDGKSTLDVLIPAGDYADGASLAVAMQAAINADANLTAFGKSLTVGWTGTGFSLASKAIGGGSLVSVDTMSPDLVTRLGLGAWTNTNGTNVSGKINGVAATGIDDRLIAPPTAGAGLVLLVRPGATAATVNVNGGITGAMADIYSSLATGDGALASALARITKEQTAIAADSAKVDAKSASMKDTLTRQFAAMEAAVAAFKSTQDFLEQQIDAWNAARSN